MTIEEFKEINYTPHTIFDEGTMEQVAIDFAKYHVQEALKEACDKVEIHSHTSSYYSREFEEGIRTRSIYVPDNSILNAYPFHLII